jgi:hypothetical protein
MQARIIINGKTAAMEVPHCFVALHTAAARHSLHVLISY